MYIIYIIYYTHVAIVAFYASWITYSLTLVPAMCGHVPLPKCLPQIYCGYCGNDRDYVCIYTYIYIYIYIT